MAFHFHSCPLPLLRCRQSPRILSYPPAFSRRAEAAAEGSSLFLGLESQRDQLTRGCAFVCSAKRSRKTLGPTKSNDEICNEIRGFILQMGLPDDHLPSIKELSTHGREDLAHILRRRGYKVIAELLKNSLSKNDDVVENLDQNLEMVNACEDEYTDTSNGSVNSPASPSVSSVVENFEVSKIGAISTDTLNTQESSQSSSGPLYAKALDVDAGELNQLEGSSNIDKWDMPTKLELKNAVKEVASLQNEKEQCARNNTKSSNWETTVTDNEDEVSIMDVEEDNQSEIDLLKVMLHQKELELAQLKEQIEKTQLSFSILQARGKAETSRTQKILSMNDMELRAYDESLSGLKEVVVEYEADGETVEIAGSFNGWHHFIKMDLHPLSKAATQPSPRNSKLWSAVLWLYPGVYEIKFIVDGCWLVDSKREVTTKCGITNNILRVER